MAWRHFQQLAGGMNYSGSDFIKNPWDLKILNGCNVDFKIGSIVKDLGYAQVGDVPQAGNKVLGLFDFRQQAGTQKIFVTINSSDDADMELKYNNAGTWTLISAGASWDGFEDCAVEMESMDQHCYFVGYDSTDNVFLPVASVIGTTFSTSTNVTNMPTAKYIKRYRDRIYIGNCIESGTLHEYRVYFSTVPVSDAITWTVADNFFDVDYSEIVTGLGSNWDRLVVFTEYTAYFYNQVSSKKVWDVGCTNHRTIRTSGQWMFWANQDGVWRSRGGEPENISGKMKSFIDAATPANFFSEVVGREYYIYIGTVTVDGITYTNTEMVFNIAHETWRLRELKDNITIYAKFSNSGSIELYHGDTDGEVMTRSKYSDSTPIYADDGTAIKAHFQHILLDLGSPQDRKRINKIITYSERAQGLLMSARVIDKNEMVLTDWKPLGQLTKYITEHTVSPNKGNFLQIQGRENSTNPYFIFDGWSCDFQLDSQNR